MKKNIKLILALLILEVYTVTSKSLRNSEEAAADVRDDQGLKDLARQLVKSKDSGHIDCDNILVWDALLQEEGNQENTITTCGLCSHDEFLKMHMPLFERHCGYGKGGFPSICFNPAGWENLLYSFKEEQLVKACALCDNGMFKRVHPTIFEENCEHDGEDEEEETRGAAEEEGGEDEEEDTRGAAEEEGGEDEEEDTRGAVEEEGGEDEEEDTRGAAEEEGGEDEEEDTRGAAEEEGGEDEEEDTRGAAEEEGGEDEEEDTRGAAEEEGGEDEEEDTRGVAEEEGGEDEEEDTRGADEEVEPDHEEDTRGDKLDFIDKGKTDDDDLVLAVEQFVRDTAKNMEALANRLDRYEKQQKIQEWKP